jgi:hypothetical protein
MARALSPNKDIVMNPPEPMPGAMRERTLIVSAIYLNFDYSPGPPFWPDPPHFHNIEFGQPNEEKLRLRFESSGVMHEE